MSDIGVYTTIIEKIHNHPYADRLEIAKIFGTQTIVTKGQFEVGEVVIYFPPDLMLPDDVAAELGVTKYLKHSRYDGVHTTKCRIAAARLRQIPSYGFITKAKEGTEPDQVLTEEYRAKKYQPPVKAVGGDAAPEHVGFPKYTGIQHWWRFSEIFKEVIGEDSIHITEKIHGTNFRCGCIDGEFLVGSHNTRRKLGRAGVYDIPMQDPKMLKALEEAKKDGLNIILYGEIYGQGVQDMDYGTLPTYAIFDIKKNSEYLCPAGTEFICNYYNIPHVPILYTGPYKEGIVEEYTSGNTELNPSRHFAGREGIVIKPMKPKYHGTLGRLILKSVSADYYDRKEKSTDMTFDAGERDDRKNKTTN